MTSTFTKLGAATAVLALLAACEQGMGPTPVAATGDRTMDDPIDETVVDQLSEPTDGVANEADVE